MTPLNHYNDARQFCLKALIDTAHAALNIAKTIQPQVIPSQDTAVVTAADLAVSNYIIKQFTGLMPRLLGGAVIIDEEAVSATGLTPDSPVLKAPWLLVSDPIDGSLLYSQGSNLYAVSLAIYHKGEAFVSVVARADGVMLWFDGDSVFQHVEGSSPLLLTPADYAITDAKMVFQSANPGLQQRLRFSPQGFGWNRYNPYGCVSRMMGLVPLHGKTPQACASTHVDKFWDIAGMWPILEALGITLFNLEETVGGAPGKAQPLFCGFHPDYFGPDWRLKGIHLATRPEHLEYILTDIFESLRPGA